MKKKTAKLIEREDRVDETGLDRCKDFDTKRQFLLDYVEKIVFLNDSFSIYGSVPVQDSKIEFKVGGSISPSERRALYRNRNPDRKISSQQYDSLMKLPH